MTTKQSDASALAPLLDGSTAGELIPELVRHCLQQLIKLEVAAVCCADRHERIEERFLATIWLRGTSNQPY
jgi:putative transposase